PSTERSYGGRVLVRMPPNLHRRLAEGAEAEGVSLNQHIVGLLAEASVLHAVKNEIRGLLECVITLQQRMDDWEAYQFEYRSPQQGFMVHYSGVEVNGYAIQG
ncbi:toxin-antitoxin system HicB family antitoxin, partial [Helicobacter pylori]|nr:toxin-antitoxin system HicB family antitoxin [Helicobacter pylori]